VAGKDVGYDGQAPTAHGDESPAADESSSGRASSRRSYHRGHVTIVDREKLEGASCECYRVATELLKNVTRRGN
jgi:hypothetical protein